MVAETRQRLSPSASGLVNNLIPYGDDLLSLKDNDDAMSKAKVKRLRSVARTRSVSIWRVICIAGLIGICGFVAFADDNFKKSFLEGGFHNFSKSSRSAESKPMLGAWNQITLIKPTRVQVDTRPPVNVSSVQVANRLRESMQGAKNFLHRRRAGYQQSGRLSQWAFRGVGYLYTHHDMVLSALVPESPVKPGRNVVHIFDINGPDRLDCHLLTIWVRVNGPEIFAGSAESVLDDNKQKCHWEFSFNLQVVGEYEVDAKLLNWNGAAIENDPNNMPIHLGNDVPWEKYPNHVSVLGFKLYDPPHSCCEACSRTKGCVYWSAPALHFDHGWSCEFYFNDTDATAPYKHYSPKIKKEYVKKELRHKTKAHGPPHSKATSYYMGCGWNFFLTGVSQCEHPLDDAVYTKENKFMLTEPLSVETSSIQKRLPLCDLDQHESLDGRWVREQYPDEATCPREMDTRKDIYSRLKHHDLLMFQSDNPHCWFRDDMTTLGTRCFVDGCGTNKKMVWKSSIVKDHEWYGMWKNYACDYVELTNAELQQCFDNRKIVSMQTHGTSVAGYINEYLQQRLSHVKFFDAEATDTPKEHTLNVTLDTFSSPHLMWHNSSEEWKREFEEQPSPLPWEEHYYAETMYFVSEREPFCTAPRAQVINRDMEEILIPKGFKKLNAFEMSSAFSYDSATQMDGMHIIGPPLRMIITKLFHYVCHDHLYRSGADVY